MGTFQSGINNILGAVAGATTVISGQIQKNKEAEIKANEIKAKKEAETQEKAEIKAKKEAEAKEKAEIKAKKEAEAKEKAEIKAKKEAEDASNAEKAEIEALKEKLSDARQMAIGYTAKDIKKQKAEKALGLNNPLTMPKGVGKKTFDRRIANALAMEEIQNQYIQKKEYRERFKNLKASDIASAIKPVINKKEAKK